MCYGIIQKGSKKSQKSTCKGVLFLGSCRPKPTCSLKEELHSRCLFACEFSDILQDSVFTEHLLLAASVGYSLICSRQHSLKQGRRSGAWPTEIGNPKTHPYQIQSFEHKCFIKLFYFI